MADKRLRHWYIVHANKEILLAGKVLHETAWITVFDNASKHLKVTAILFKEKDDYEASLLLSGSK